MMTSFDKGFEKVLGHEGFYSDDPSDPGGETIYGIARRKNPSWKGWKLVDKSKTLPEFPRNLKGNLLILDLVKSLYKTQYWDIIWGDLIASYSERLAIDLFDMCINIGIGRTGKFLQRSLNAMNNRQRLWPNISVDGIVGKKTIATFELAMQHKEIDPVRWLYKLVNTLQGCHYFDLLENDEEFEKYRGWWSRVDFIQEG